MSRLLRNLIIACTVVISAIYSFKYGVSYDDFDGDCLFYYSYLPSTFIYHNLGHQDVMPHKGIDSGIYLSFYDMRGRKTETGHTLNQYTYGVALMEAPFFLLVHAGELMLGLPANGYSMAYHMMLKVVSLFYVVVGLVILYNILKKYFSAGHSFLAVITIFLGTNLFWFAIVQDGMSHGLLFCLYAALIYFTVSMHENPGKKYFIAAGLMAGLITVMRPSDVLCLFIPLLYGIYNIETLRKKLLFIRSNVRGLLLFSLSFIIPIIPQLIYWKAASGHFIVYSYGAQTFNWRHPRILSGLFYFKNGWLAYSPVMAFSILGLLLYKHYRKWIWSISVILPVYIYVIYSWWCYNYINGLGSRPMIHMYPLLALPLTAFIQYVAARKMYIKILFSAVFIFLIAVNLSYSMQEAKKVLDSPRSNMQFNLQMLFRTELRYKDLVTFDMGIKQPDTTGMTRVSTLIYDNYEDSVSDHYVHDTANGSRYVYHMKPGETYLQPPVITYDRKKFGDARWFKCSGRFMYPICTCPFGSKDMLMIAFRDQPGIGCLIENKVAPWENETIPGMQLFYYKPYQWGYVYFFAPVPKTLKDGDPIKIFVWNITGSDLYADDMRLELYK